MQQYSWYKTRKVNEPWPAICLLTIFNPRPWEMIIFFEQNNFNTFLDLKDKF